jgi:ribosomal protein S27E
MNDPLRTGDYLPWREVLGYRASEALNPGGYELVLVCGHVHSCGEDPYPPSPGVLRVGCQDCRDDQVRRAAGQSPWRCSACSAVTWLQPYDAIQCLWCNDGCMSPVQTSGT